MLASRAEQRVTADRPSKDSGSTAALGRMNAIAVFCVFAGTALSSCHGSSGGNEYTLGPEQVVPLCSFAAIAASRVGNKVKVRGRLTLHQHGIVLSDERCPDVLLHLDAAPDGPDFCGPELGQQLGCPPGVGEPIVTAVGVLSSADEPTNGVLLLKQLADIAREHEGQR